MHTEDPKIMKNSYINDQLEHFEEKKYLDKVNYISIYIK